MIDVVENGTRYPVNLNVRMGLEQLRELDRLAAEWDTTVSEAARRCLSVGAQQLQGATWIESAPDATAPDET